MKDKFEELKQLYQNNKFDVLLKEPDSVYWLKLRSISRRELMLQFCDFAGLDLKSVKGPLLFKSVYKAHPSESKIDQFLHLRYQTDRPLRKLHEDELVSELYKLKILDWGGLYQNNLERAIVDNYIKKIWQFDILNRKIENEIHNSMRGYVQSSWYNHWSSIIIEDLFKDHNRVIPTVGLIKKVDFFIDDIPFDLKVTYFPEGYMAMLRKIKGLPTELQELKACANLYGVKYNSKDKESNIFSELMTRLSESDAPKIKSAFQNFINTRYNIVDEALQNKTDLIRWLYQEQGERRFDAANRLFLVLIDKTCLEDSWKMKRNLDLLKHSILSYLDRFKYSKDMLLSFKWKDEKIYHVLSDMLFIVKQ